jgi:ribosomal protein S3
MMGITRFQFNEDDGILTIQLHRPGIFIGSMGDNLYGIEKKLKEENPSLKKIKLVEETLNDFIYPVDYTEEEDY